MRDIDIKDTIEVEVEFEDRVEDLKREIEKGWSVDEDYSLFYRDVELSEDKPLKFYGLEPFDLLVLRRDHDRERSLRDDFPEDQKNVSLGKRWLERNIGLDPDGLELNEYSRSGSKETEMTFEQGDTLYQVKVDEERIEEYDVFSKEG